VGVHDRLTTVITIKGQVSLPKAIRDQFQWGAGTRLTVESTPDGVLLKSTPVFAASSIDALFGSNAARGTSAVDRRHECSDYAGGRSACALLIPYVDGLHPAKRSQ